jgi:hypothetical protein
MNYNGWFFVFQFEEGIHATSHKVQLQRCIAGENCMTKYVVDSTSPVKDITTTNWYFCRENRQIYSSGDGRVSVVTVVVIGELELRNNHGPFSKYILPNGPVWQCHNYARFNMADGTAPVPVVLTQDARCNMKLVNSGDWFFEVARPVHASSNRAIMTVKLIRENISERALRRRNGEKGNHTSVAV